ncbi:MAG: hypothetical protein ACRYHA_07500 [Janthinobacterium lividum]
MANLSTDESYNVQKYIEDSLTAPHKWVGVGFYVTCLASVVFATIFLGQAYFSNQPLNVNATNLTLNGALVFALSIGALIQIKWIKPVVSVSIVGIFLAAVLRYVIQDASNQTIGILHRHFLFDATQLTQAVSTGTLYITAIEIGQGAALAFIPLIIVIAIALDKAYKDKNSRLKSLLLAISCLGLIFSALSISKVAATATRAVGLDVVILKTAYDVDFSSHYDCPKAELNERVFLSKTSDTAGYAARMTFPEKPLLSIKASDIGSDHKVFGRAVKCNPELS